VKKDVMIVDGNFINVIKILLNKRMENIKREKFALNVMVLIGNINLSDGSYNV